MTWRRLKACCQACARWHWLMASMKAKRPAGDAGEVVFSRKGSKLGMMFSWLISETYQQIFSIFSFTRVYHGLPNLGDLRAPVLANVGPNRLAQGDFRDFPQASVPQLPGDVSSWRHQNEPSLEFLPAICIIFCFGPDDYDLQIEWRPIVHDEVWRIIEKLYVYNITMHAYRHTYTHIPKSCRNPGLMSLEAMNWFAISLGPFELLMGDWAVVRTMGA